MKYFDIPEPHGFLIWRGKQTAIASDQPLLSDEKALIVSGGRAFGEVVLSQPVAVNLSEFEKLEKEHATRPEERRLNYPDSEVFYVHRFKAWEPYADSQVVELENGDAKLVELPELTPEQQKLIEQAEKLPKTLILSEDVVTLSDSGYEIAEGLDSSKIEPLLKAVFEDLKLEQDSLPLYQLGLIRTPRLGFKAEGTKPYKIMMDSDECEGHAVVKKDTGKLMGCHDTHEEAMGQMAALMMAEEKGRGASGGRDKPKKTSSGGGRPKKAAGRKEEQPLAVFEDQKEMSLDAKVNAIRDGFYSQYNPRPPQEKQYEERPWLREVYSDYAIVGQSGGKLYKVDYSVDEEGKAKFADKSKWVEMQTQLVPTGNVGAKTYEEALESKSFSEWLDDYYELGTKELSELTEEEAIKAVWTSKYIGSLPNSSFLYVEPECDKQACKHLPYKDAEGNVDMPHLRNAASRLGQSATGAVGGESWLTEDLRKKLQGKVSKLLEANKEDGEKTGRRVKKTMVEKIKNAFETLKEFMTWAEKQEDEDEEMPMGMMSLFSNKSAVGIKKVGDKWWYFTWSTNAFQDREKEIFSTKSLENYVSEAEKKADRGYFNLWHIQTKEYPDLTDFAKKEWQGVAGRFLIEGGPFLDNDKGKKFLEFFKDYSESHPTLAPEGWGCSPEYKYLPEERETKVYKNIWITRTSTLPKMAAANIWTLGGMTMALSDQQKKALETILGEGDAKKIVEIAEAKTKELEEAGVAHKSNEEESTMVNNTTVVVEQDKVVDAVADVVVEKLGEKMTADWSPLQQVLETLLENQKAQDAKIEQLTKELQGANSEEAKQAKKESPKYVWSLTKRASEASETTVAEDDPLKNQKPAEAQKQDKSGANAFFAGR